MTLLRFPCFLALLLSFCGSAIAFERPNVVLLLADDLGSKDIGCDGGPVKTPAIDGLAEQGVRFTQFYSAAPVCSPARATFLTGRHHVRTGVYTVIQDHMHDMHLLPDEVTIAEVLKANGYDTAHFGKWHLGTPFRGRKKPWIDEHGFDYWFATDLNASPSHLNPTNFWRNRKRVGTLEGYACQIVVDEAISWLDKHRTEDNPFFLNIWFHEPHARLAAPPEIVRQYGAVNEPAAIYSATIDNTDRAIKRLLQKLEAIGASDNTIIVYTSDHGSYRRERNGSLRGSKGSLYEGGIRTPGIFSWPAGIAGGRVLTTPAGHVDLMPTLCGLCDIEPPENIHLDGTDLTPLLTKADGHLQRHQPLTWHSPCSQPVVVMRESNRAGDYSLVGFRAAEYPRDQQAIAAVMTEMGVILEQELGRSLNRSELQDHCWNFECTRPDWLKLRSQFVHLNTFQESWTPLIKSGSGGISRWELYDLATDPNQQKNIAADHPQLVEQLQTEALKIHRDVLKEATVWKPSRMDARPAKTSPATAAQTNSKNTKETEGDDALRKLLTRIEETDLPAGYRGETHQQYVDRRMAGMTEQQRGQLGRLWKDKRRLEPNLKNAGASFVRILEYVANDGRVPKTNSPKEKPTRITHRVQDARPIKAIRLKPDPINSGDIDPDGKNWHHWRGPEATGVSRTANPPIEWSEEKNVKWKVAIAGQGNATPIVWGNKVFVLTAINTGRIDPSLPKPEDQPDRVFGIKYPNTFYKFDVICLDRNTGHQLWRQTASEHVPHEGTHRDADFASASPTTDGKRLYCWFGSAGLYCYDLNGKALWQRDLGKAYVGASLGEGASPVVHDNRLVIVRDHARQSTIEVLDASNGETLWKKDRDEPNAWATPRVIEFEGCSQVITTASNMVRSYDLDTGDIIWQCRGLTGNCTPCPVIDGELVLCMSGYEGHSLLAIPLNSQGDLSGSNKFAWTRDRGTPYVPSPVLYDGLLYFTQSNQNVLTVVDSQTGGTVLDRTRLPSISNVYSSPVAAANRVYYTGRNGATVVLRRLERFEVLSKNKLEDEINASPALVGNQLFLRGRKALYCLEDLSVAAASDSNSPAMEKQTHIHRFASTHRSVFDAFTYVNRIPEEPEVGEKPVDFSSRIASRLANQEGRILLKLPPGMTRAAYEGFKLSMGIDWPKLSHSEAPGNEDHQEPQSPQPEDFRGTSCIACHKLPNFVGIDHGEAVPTLRNRTYTHVRFRELLQSKPHQELAFDDSGIRRLHAFVECLKDVPDPEFRPLILNAAVLDTSGDIE